jgi:hypothetical protein
LQELSSYTRYIKEVAVLLEDNDAPCGELGLRIRLQLPTHILVLWDCIAALGESVSPYYKTAASPFTREKKVKEDRNNKIGSIIANDDTDLGLKFSNIANPLKDSKQFAFGHLSI